MTPPTWLLATVVLAGLVLFVYWGVWRFDFLSFDDPAYVKQNATVAAGLTWSGVTWAFTSAHAGFWIPLTWLSYMAEVQAFGVNPAVPHVTNVLLHLLAAILLYGLLWTLTGSTGRSLFVSALFAVHPLHVESVAWITERKDVLSAVFLFLALHAYVRHVRRPSSWTRAWLGASFACGIMAKPMVVTLPALLLLLDAWPLRRLSWTSDEGGAHRHDGPRVHWTRALAEKWWLGVMAAAAAVTVFVTQREVGAVGDAIAIGPMNRAATAVTACALYLRKTVWPADLSAFYPYRFTVEPASVGLACAVLVVASAAVIRWRGRAYLPVGWLWYLIALLPVMGLIQVGNQSMADRFTYLPLVGLFVMVAWSVPDLATRGPRLSAAAAAATAVLALAAAAHVQVAVWQDDETLWTHALAVDPENYFAHNSLGRVLFARGDVQAAAQHFSESVRLNPRFYDGRHNLGLTDLRSGRIEEAIEQFREASRLKPTSDTLANLGAALALKGDLAGAEQSGRQAVALDKASPEAHFDLGLTLARQGRPEEALGEFVEARRLNADLPSVHQALGETYLSLGRLADATESFRAATRLLPQSAESFHGLGKALAGLGPLGDAIAAYAEAVRLAPGRGEYRFDLGFSLAAAGRPGEAVPHLEEASRLAPSSDTAQYYYGLALAASGRLGEARAPIQEALRLNPGNEAARHALTRLPPQ